MTVVVKIKDKEYKLEKAMDVSLYPDYEHVDKNDLVYLVYRDAFIRGFLVITGKKQGNILFCTPSVPHRLNAKLFEDVSPENINILSKYGKIQKLYDLLPKVLLAFGFIIGFLCFVFTFMAVNYSIFGSIVCGCIGFTYVVWFPPTCMDLKDKELHFVHNR